ncbi:hypothetical protein [Moorena sp. SIO4G3]|uniref:hypothetical protein n=1 Tax=Moorena sp. SIO4G3 TaxID=2607821 RepID=UPI001428ED33|nr:hypothetical protein [Moorena sp. SIO4G3]NEO82366.1 hypothetical protein [Moorena sp. SIO4G3]
MGNSINAIAYMSPLTWHSAIAKRRPKATSLFLHQCFFPFPAFNDSRLPTPDSLPPTPYPRHPTPDTRHPTPDSRLPTPDSRLPTP